MQHASRIIEERKRRRREIIDKLVEYTRDLRRTLGKVTVVLYGSYARGDFNAWSDIDLIIISDAFENIKFTMRWRLLPEPPEGLESLDAITWTRSEAAILLSKPSWRKALKHSMVIANDYGIVLEKNS